MTKLFYIYTLITSYTGWQLNFRETLNFVNVNESTDGNHQKYYLSTYCTTLHISTKLGATFGQNVQYVQVNINNFDWPNYKVSFKIKCKSQQNWTSSVFIIGVVQFLLHQSITWNCSWCHKFHMYRNLFTDYSVISVLVSFKQLEIVTLISYTVTTGLGKLHLIKLHSMQHIWVFEHS